MIWDEDAEVWEGPDPLHDREPDDDDYPDDLSDETRDDMLTILALRAHHAWMSGSRHTVAEDVARYEAGARR